MAGISVRVATLGDFAPPRPVSGYTSRQLPGRTLLILGLSSNKAGWGRAGRARRLGPVAGEPCYYHFFTSCPKTKGHFSTSISKKRGLLWIVS